MNQSQVITTLSQRFPQLVRQDAELAVTEIFDAVARALINGWLWIICIELSATAYGTKSEDGERKWRSLKIEVVLC
jgi:hypothetical protein